MTFPSLYFRFVIVFIYSFCFFSGFGQVQTETQKILAFDGEPIDLFGWAIDVEGDYMATSSHRTGGVYIYRYEQDNWNFSEKLPFSSKEVRMEEGYLITGGPGRSMLVYQNINENWIRLDTIFNPSGLCCDGFGTSIDISEDYIIIGADDAKDEDGIDTGVAYVFQKNENAWDYKVTLTPSDGEAGDNFGSSVGISGNNVIIGSNRHGVGGAAYIFQKSNNIWNQTKKLTIPSSSNNFGNYVSISSNTIIVSEFAGSLFVYERSNNDWILTTELLPINERDNTRNYFGGDIKINDNLIIGANRYTGSAFIFEKKGNVWEQTVQLNASDAIWSDNFGTYNVGISENRVVIGSYYDDNENGEKAGAVYSFEFCPHLAIDSFSNEIAWNINPSDGILDFRNDTLVVNVDYLNGLSLNDFILSDAFKSSDVFLNNYCCIDTIQIEREIPGIGDVECTDEYPIIIWNVIDECGKAVRDSIWIEQFFNVNRTHNELDEFCLEDPYIDISLWEGKFDVFGNYMGVRGENQVYIYERIDNKWEFSQELSPPSNGYFDDIQSASIKMKEGYLVVRGIDSLANVNFHKTCLFLYKLENSEWTYSSTVLNPSITNDNSFGAFSFDLHNEYIIVGANNYRNEKGENVGAAYVFENADDNWILLQTITRNETLNDFGRSVNINEETIVIGGYRYTYIYQKTVNGWQFLQKTYDDGTYTDLSSNTLLIGRTIYSKENNYWKRIQELNSPDFYLVGTKIKDDFIIDINGDYGTIYKQENNCNWKPYLKLIPFDFDNVYLQSIAISDEHIYIGGRKQGGISSIYTFDNCPEIVFDCTEMEILGFNEDRSWKDYELRNDTLVNYPDRDAFKISDIILNTEKGSCSMQSEYVKYIEGNPGLTPCTGEYHKVLWAFVDFCGNEVKDSIWLENYCSNIPQFEGGIRPSWTSEVFRHLDTLTMTCSEYNNIGVCPFTAEDVSYTTGGCNNSSTRKIKRRTKKSNARFSSGECEIKEISWYAELCRKTSDTVKLFVKVMPDENTGICCPEDIDNGPVLDSFSSARKWKVDGDKIQSFSNDTLRVHSFDYATVYPSFFEKSDVIFSSILGIDSISMETVDGESDFTPCTGDYPRVIWTATDFCGNTTKDSIWIERYCPNTPTSTGEISLEWKKDVSLKNGDTLTISCEEYAALEPNSFTDNDVYFSTNCNDSSTRKIKRRKKKSSARSSIAYSEECEIEEIEWYAEVCGKTSESVKLFLKILKDPVTNKCCSSCKTEDIILSNTIYDYTYQSAGNIFSDGSLETNSEVILKAGNSITLQENFHAEEGSSFTAIIENCNNELKERAAVKQSQPTPKEAFLKCFPNPAKSDLNINYAFEQPQKAILSIYNLEGRLVKQLKLSGNRAGEGQTITISINELNVGFHYLILQGETELMSEKIIILE